MMSDAEKLCAVLCVGDCYLEYDRVTGRYVDPNQPNANRSVLDTFAPQLKLSQPNPDMTLQPTVSSNGQLDQGRHYHAAAAIHKDADEVDWEDIVPSPDDEIKQYVNGQMM